MSETRERAWGKLIPLLQRAQAEQGYLSREALRQIARELRIPESKVYGVATFYAQFRLTPSGRRRVMICRGTACHVRGGSRILAEVQRRLGLQEGQTSPDLEYTLETVACIGACALAPCLMINQEVHGRLNTLKIAAIFGDRGDGHV